MPRSSQSETTSGSPPTYRTRFPIEIPFLTCQLVRARGPLIDEVARNEISDCHSPLLFDSTEIWTVLRPLQAVLSGRVECGMERYCSTVSLKRLVFRAGRKLEHRSR